MDTKTEIIQHDNEDIEFLESQDEQGDIWGPHQINHLLQLRFDREHHFLNPKMRKKKMWREIADEFNKNGFSLTGEKMEKKYNNLKQTYLKNLEKKERGKKYITWEYFDTMHKVLGPRIQTSRFESQTMGRDLYENTFLGDDGEETIQEHNQAGRSNNKYDLAREKFEWKKKKVEALEKTELEKIRAIKDLAAAIRELAKNRNK